MLYIYFVQWMNHGEAADGCNSKDFCQKVGVHEVMDCLVIHGVCIVDKHLGQQPV